MLTKKQKNLLIFINKKIRSTGISPSYEEMKNSLNLKSKSGIHRLISALEERGSVKRLAHKGRALEVVKLPENASANDIFNSFTPSVIKGGLDKSKSNSSKVSVLGSIAAGTPIEAIQHEVDQITLPAELQNNGEHFGLKIKGDSMIGAGINNGDTVVIKRTPNVDNGEIISMVSLPDFNLNKRENIKDKIYINRATKGVYELGSVFKTFTLAAGINEGVIDTDTKFIDLPKKIWCAGNPIGEYDDKIQTDLTAEQIFVRSGNIGSARIAQKIGIEKFENFLNKIGILEKLEFDIYEVGEPQAGRWGKCKLATAAYGHGVSTTLLQLAKAYAIIVNGGYEVKPTLIKKDYNKNTERIRILNEQVSNKVKPASEVKIA